MAKRGRPAKGSTALGRWTKTSLVIPLGLLRQLKHAAVDEGTDVSTLLCGLAEAHLKRRKGGR